MSLLALLALLRPIHLSKYDVLKYYNPNYRILYSGQLIVSLKKTNFETGLNFKLFI